MLETDLGRAQDVAGRMKRHFDATDVDCLAVVDRSNRCPGAETTAQHMSALVGPQVAPTARTGMVRMAMGEDGTIDGPVGIDIEIAGRAVEPSGGAFQQIEEPLFQA